MGLGPPVCMKCLRREAQDSRNGVAWAVLRESNTTSSGRLIGSAGSPHVAGCSGASVTGLMLATSSDVSYVVGGLGHGDSSGET